MRPLQADEDDMKYLTLMAALLGGSPALAEPFVLLIYESAAELALREDKGAAGQAYWGAYAAFGQEAQAAGVVRGGAAMVPVAVAGAGPAATDGLTLGGFFLLDVADAAAAEAWAAKLPAATTGRVEVRAGIAAPGM
ncbi:YciI family protein [Fertoebacter nigrum]|uniref:YciI family protein n=1 Tax=Fertoeibacter niger TaxID=2656921 RepID=A0A8X8GXT2_9RHOB|nr:YciI family protein [Fertoeibacter niger]NUB43150.1 YciI family protein [Fertoeibacter niger]